MVFGGVLEAKLAPSWAQVGSKMEQNSKKIVFLGDSMPTSLFGEVFVAKKLDFGRI